MRMSWISRFVCPVLLSALASPAQAAGWKLVFSDEFSGPALDRQVWATRYAYDNELCDTFEDNGERQRYRDHRNHEQHDGRIDLIARKVPVDAKHEFESGMLRSYQTFYYGYFEARVKTPSAKGTWPAFWLAPDFDQDGSLTHPPEIDIFDNANNGKDASASTVYSGAGENEGGKQGGELVWADEAVDPKWAFYQSGQDLTADWHVYGLLWTPHEITLWLDGKRIYTRKYFWVSNDGKRPGPAHVLLNLAVGGPWAGRYGIDDQAFPQTFSIDYVRVCQITEGKEGQPSCGASKLAPDPNSHAYRNPIAGGGDMLRPVLFDAELSKTRLRAGETVEVSHRFSSAVSTKQPHRVFQYLVDADGKTVSRTSRAPAIPTTQWAGRSVRVKLPLTLPAELAAGKYRLFVALGTPEPTDPEAATSLQALTLRYAADARHRERIGQPLRYLAGELEVTQ
jgi:beta-glucanase (GH16 family)